MNLTRRRFLFAALLSLATPGIGLSAESELLRLAQTIPLPGVKGRFDHFACDAATGRVVVAALANDTGEVIDVTRAKRLHTIAGLHKPTGALMLEGRICFANGDDGSFRGYDAVSFAEVAKLEGLDDADNVRFDRAAKVLYVGYGEGALAAVNPEGNRLLHTISLAAHPESFQLETRGPRIFVNVPGKKQIAVVDRAKRAVVDTWPMTRWQANFPMALDEQSQRLFVGCRDPARLVILDSAAGNPIADLEISGDTDDLFFDAKRQRIYVSCGQGFLDVIQRRGGDAYERVARVPTRAGARTSYFSGELDRLVLAVPERGEFPAEIRVYQPGG